MGTLQPEPIVLYSTNTWLAYMIAERYYGGDHYVWCTPFFDPRKGASDSAVPPTSSPFEMYWGLSEEIRRRDRHSHRVQENRAGVLRGANAKRAAGLIDARQESEIVTIVDLAHDGDFRPIVYVIPFVSVASLVREPPPEEKAHPLSAEYIIDQLPRKLFDVIELGEVP